MIQFFKEYNLDKTIVFEIGVGTAVVCIFSVILGRLANFEPKRLAWVISLVNSLAMVILGFSYVFVKKWLKNFSPIWEADDFLGIDNVAVITCTIFGVSNFCDLVLGLIFYPKYLGLLTAWVHHILYIWLMVFSTTGYGVFTTHHPFAQGFMWNIIEELPTFFLALGTIYPSLRTDWGFGVSFFLLRILYHSLLSVYAVTSTAYGPVVISIYFLTLAMHVNWFTTWCNKYGAKLLKELAKPKNN